MSVYQCAHLVAELRRGYYISQRAVSSCWCWEVILAPLEEQLIFLTVESTFQSTTFLTTVAL